jgi:hypothetical protein
MNKEDFIRLDRGDLVRHRLHNECYIVDANHGGGIVTAVNTITIANPDEFVLVAKAQYKDPCIKAHNLPEIKCPLNTIYPNCSTCTNKKCLDNNT